MAHEICLKNSQWFWRMQCRSDILKFKQEIVMKELKSVYIANSHLFINGDLVLKGENPIFVKFLKEIYKYAELKYPKYFKMDPLSKLGFLCAEVLLKGEKLPNEPERIGIVLENKVSTYIVDSKHQESINDKTQYFPSPANFVYTLPNVMTGEICIRNGFKGENAVFVNDAFSPEFISQYIGALYYAKKADYIIGGFVDADEDDYEGFMFVSRRETWSEHSHGMIKNEYEKIRNNIK
jgi:hypothetical protein